MVWYGGWIREADCSPGIPSRRLLQSYRWDGGPVSMKVPSEGAVSRTQSQNQKAHD